MKSNTIMSEEQLINEAMTALMDKLGPVETMRFIALPKKKRLNSVRRHRLWQEQLDKDKLFDEVFKK